MVHCKKLQANLWLRLASMLHKPRLHMHAWENNVMRAYNAMISFHFFVVKDIFIIFCLFYVCIFYCWVFLGHRNFFCDDFLANLSLLWFFLLASHCRKYFCPRFEFLRRGRLTVYQGKWIDKVTRAIVGFCVWINWKTSTIVIILSSHCIVPFICHLIGQNTSHNTFISSSYCLLDGSLLCYPTCRHHLFICIVAHLSSLLTAQQPYLSIFFFAQTTINKQANLTFFFLSKNSDFKGNWSLWKSNTGMRLKVRKVKFCLFCTWVFMQ